jgi:hypothetical protein
MNAYIEEVVRVLSNEHNMDQNYVDHILADLERQGPDKITNLATAMKCAADALYTLPTPYNHKVGRRKPPRSSRRGLTFSCERQIVLPASTR